MITFILGILLLLAGFFFYGKRAEKLFGADDRKTPAVEINDGVDYTPMKTWKLYLIQLLNIAGLGPILGALNGALFGPVVYLWIVLGCIFAGAVHDYLSGMISLRHKGLSLSELVGLYLGKRMRVVIGVFTVVLGIMVGVVFSKGPAGLLAKLTPGFLNETIWLWIIIAYYFIATFVPIGSVIGKIYPLFGVCLMVMALGVGGSLLFSGKFNMPELWQNFGNLHPQNISIWPFMFITVACGAISGFHATQSPMVARCCISEKQGHTVFYGAMITEGFIALVWAAAGVSCYDSTQALLEAGGGVNDVVYAICSTTMGKIGSVIAMLGVIACPITTGDTSYRSARLTLADWLHMDQQDWKKRLLLTIPLLTAGALICQVDYSILWRYFSWANQALAMISLWMIAVYLRQNGKSPWISVLPAMLMSCVSICYLFVAPECFGSLWKALNVPYAVYYPLGLAIGIASAVCFLFLFLRKKAQPQLQ